MSIGQAHGHRLPASYSVDRMAAGHVVAKTGTLVSVDLLNCGLVVDGKGLAGYLTTRSGRRLAFAIYLNRVKLEDSESAVAICRP